MLCYCNANAKAAPPVMDINTDDQPKVGDVAHFTSDGQKNNGIIKFLGDTSFSKGIWCGCELDDAIGKNNGTIKGVTYFVCKQKHGLFIKLENLISFVSMPSASEKMGELLCAKCEMSGPSPKERIIEIQQILSSPTATPVINYRRSADGMTPLLISALHNRHELVRYLLSDCNANPCLNTSLNETPLYLACVYDNLRTCRVLLECTPTPNTMIHVRPKDALELTCLHVAAQYGRSQLVSLLLEHGANPLEIDLKGNLPVHMACSNAHAVCVERLLYAQASLSMKNIYGKTPVDVAHARVPNDPQVNMILLDFFERESTDRRVRAKRERKRGETQGEKDNIDNDATRNVRGSSSSEVHGPPPSFAAEKDKRAYAAVKWDFRQSGQPGDSFSSLDAPIIGFVSKFLKAYSMVWPQKMFGDEARNPTNVRAMVSEFVRHSSSHLPKNSGHQISIWGHVREKYLQSHSRRSFVTIEQATIVLKRLSQDAVRTGKGVVKNSRSATSTCRSRLSP